MVASDESLLSGVFTAAGAAQFPRSVDGTHLYAAPHGMAALGAFAVERDRGPHA